MQADDGQQARVLHRVVADELLSGVVEYALREDNRHAPAGAKETQATLDIQHVALDLVSALVL